MPDGSAARRARSWSPRKNDISTKDHSTNFEEDRRSIHREVVSLPAGRGDSHEYGNGFQGDPNKTRAKGTMAWSFHLRRKPKRRQGVHLHEYPVDPSQVDLSTKLNVEELLVLDQEDELTKAQRMFIDKKARRETRRSLRESGDFLGVQGANPRTGYWDVSTATSSSEPSQISEETRKKLDRQERDIEEQKRRYEEAQSKHQQELKRVLELREIKKKGKALEKELEMRLRQRRQGKWRLSENGWSSVAEPDLSPIVQSIAGSPSRGKLSLLLKHYLVCFQR